MEASKEDSILLSLRPATSASSNAKVDDAGDANDASIASLLHLIGRQRGSFRNFDEASLLAEIAGTIDPDTTQTNVINEESTAQPLETADEPIIAHADDKKDEELAIVEKANDPKIRDEFFRLIGVALNEAALALDFTSLLLSATRPAAVQSISPALKDAVPIGSLAHVYVHREAQKQDPDARTRVLGYKMQGLGAASAALKEASEQTSQQVTLENVFWSEIQTLLEYGWPIFRIRAGVTGLALRFSPAQNHYIPLEMDSHGHVDVTNLSAKDSRIRYSICDSNTHRILAYLIDPPKAEDTDGEEDMDDSSKSDLPQIIQKLRRMRKSLRVSTIFGGLVRESRDLASHGLAVYDGRIRIPIHKGANIVIELVDSTESTEDVMMMMDETNQPDDSVQYLLTTLKTFVHYSTSVAKPPLRTFLVSYAHEVNKADLQVRLTKIVDGLGRQSWSLAAPTLSTETMVDALPPSSTFVITCMTTEISVKIEAFAPTNIQLSIVVSTPYANGSTTTTNMSRMTKTLRTQSKNKAIAYCKQQMLESVIRYLVACDSRISRCGETEVQAQGLVWTITLTDDGDFRLVSADGTAEKFVKAGDDLVNVVMSC